MNGGRTGRETPPTGGPEVRMRYPYAPRHLTEAARALDGEGDLTTRLYTAFQALHTLLPEHFPEGELRDGFTQLHARFTHAHPRDRAEDSVLAVLQGMDEAQKQALAEALRKLAKDAERDLQRRRL